MSIDLTRDVAYRGFLLNDAAIGDTYVGGNAIGSGISGSVIDSADFSDVDIVQFMEKRSLADGMDVGDVYKGARRIRLAGTLYATTRALLFDAAANLRAALDPVLAMRDEPGDKGYRPLTFSTPTNRLDVFPGGLILQRALALPRATQSIVMRDNLGGDDDDSLAIPWQATFIMRDPNIQGAAEQDYELVTGANTGNTVNRGNYLAIPNMYIPINNASGTIAAQVGDSVFTITLASSTSSRILRFKGTDKIVTLQEGAGAEVTRMDIIAFSGSTSWPLVVSGSTAYNITTSGITVSAGAHMWFWETYS